MYILINVPFHFVAVCWIAVAIATTHFVIVLRVRKDITSDAYPSTFPSTELTVAVILALLAFWVTLIVLIWSLTR